MNAFALILPALYVRTVFRQFMVGNNAELDLNVEACDEREPGESGGVLTGEQEAHGAEEAKSDGDSVGEQREDQPVALYVYGGMQHLLSHFLLAQHISLCSIACTQRYPCYDN